MRHTCRSCSVLLPILLVCLAGLSVAAAPPPAQPLVTFPNPGPDVLADLAGRGWDIWEVAPTRVTARLTPGQLAELHRQGLDATPLGAELQYVVRFPQCYRTFDAAVDQLRGWTEAYPDLAELIDAGPSWHATQGLADRRLWVLRITNRQNLEPKPGILIVALHHAREIVTPEIALNLAELLLTGYGNDADLTWIVDNRETWIVPFVNPDGHLYAEYSEDWRKNANTSQSACEGSTPPNSFGIDLNRNYDHQWATVGASSNPCNLTYRGPAAFSEPETQVVRDLVQSQKFSLVLSLHSYGDLALYPWGYTYAQAPDAPALRDVAAVLTSFNGYRPRQSSNLYPTSGDTCDWVYGTQGIPCYTLEIGSGALENYFWPDCQSADAQWLENRDALLYAIKLAGGPYPLAQAPIVREVAVHQRGRHLVVDAILDRQPTSPEPPAGGEAFVDRLGSPGSGVPLVPADRVLDLAVEQMTGIIDLAGIEGRHTLYVLGVDDGGRHGPPAALYFESCLDVTNNGAVDVGDVMALAAIWRTRSGDVEFDAALDLNANAQIDVQDIGRMAAAWGTSCDS